MLLNVPKSTRRSYEEEIIEDSEPERELHRKQRKAKTTAGRIACNDLSISETARKPVLNSLLNEVIEISDSDSEPCALGKDILTSADPEGYTIPQPVPPSSAPRSWQISTIDLSLSSFQKKTEDSPESLNNSPNSHEGHDAIKTIRVLDPKRFAYASTTITKRKTKTAPIAPQTARTKERQIAKFSTFDLSNDDLSKINRCVCCQASWTVRKSGHQKLMHIRSCAKKLSLKDETVCVLLQTEISKYLSPLDSKGKAKAKDSSLEAVSSTRKTFLEEVLGEESRKKVKSKQVETTLADVGSMRDSILAKAQNILSSSCRNVPELESGSAVVDQPYPLFSHRHDDEPLPLTQPFLRSSLADLHGARVSLFSSNTSPPRVNLMNSDAIQRSIHTTASKTYGSTSPPVGSMQPSHYSKDLLPASSKTIRRRRRLSLEVRCDVTSQKDRIAYLADSFENVSLSSPSPSTCSSLGRAMSTLDVQATPKGPKTAKRIPKSRSPKSSAKKKKKAVDFGAKWEAHMIKHITQDTALYQRILRYEPIHFDVFLEIAALYTPINSKTKQKTHMFLDEQAILTYGRASWGSRGL